MERIRFTIAVDPEVHAAFAEMAEVSGQSLSRAVGDWLRDTTSASRFVSQKMRELRLSPALALRELQAFQERDAENTGHMAAYVEAGKLRSDDDSKRSVSSARRSPPSSNTGGKGPKTPKPGSAA